MLACLSAVYSAQAGTITVSPISVGFGNQVLNTSAVKTATVTNGQAKSTTITTIITNQPDYSRTSNCPISPSTLAAGASCTISVTFTPSSLGLLSATLTVN